MVDMAVAGSPPGSDRVPPLSSEPWAALARLVLLLIGVGVLLFAAHLLGVQHEISVVTEKTKSSRPVELTIPSNSPASIQKNGAGRSSDMISSQSTAEVTKTTTTTATASDTLIVAWLCLAVVLVLASAFFNRMSKFSVAGATVELKDLASYVSPAADAVAKAAAPGTPPTAASAATILAAVQGAEIALSGRRVEPLWDRLARRALEEVQQESSTEGR